MRLYIKYSGYAEIRWTNKFTIKTGDKVEFVMNTYGFPYKADIVAKVNDVEVARASS
jgi:hypothetical protein